MEFLGDSVSPFTVFSEWFSHAHSIGLKDPNAMVLSTATGDGVPSSRIILLKHFDEKGFCFYTNFNSRKGRQLLSNPKAALLFYWEKLQRQIRIEGVVEEVSPAEADAYFASRRPESRLGAWASRQSERLDARSTLESRFNEFRTKHPTDDDIPRPAHWSGFRLVPDYFEFWHEIDFRMHNRRAFIKTASNWESTLLYP